MPRRWLKKFLNDRARIVLVTDRMGLLIFLNEHATSCLIYEDLG